MQKLVKKTLHYETIMPVEAYEGEDDDWETEIGVALNTAGFILSLTPVPGGRVIGGALCVTGLLVTAAHHEPTVEFVQDVMEANIEADRQRRDQDADMAQAVIDTVGDIVGGLLDYESDYPIPSGPSQPVH